MKFALTAAAAVLALSAIAHAADLGPLPEVPAPPPSFIQPAQLPGYSFYCLNGVRYYGAYPYGNPVGACLSGDRYLRGGLDRPRGFDPGRGGGLRGGDPRRGDFRDGDHRR